MLLCTDYGWPVRKSPSQHGQKSTPSPKFLGTAEANFVYHIGPNFQILWFMPSLVVRSPCSYASCKRCQEEFETTQLHSVDNARVSIYINVIKQSVKSEVFRFLGLLWIVDSWYWKKIVKWQKSRCETYIKKNLSGRWIFCLRND